MEAQTILKPEILVFVVAIAGVLVGGLVAALKVWTRHRERMTMVRHGIHPDHPLPEDEAEPGERKE